MNTPFVPDLHYSVCPHDCPSSCSLEVERLDQHTIGRVRGARGQSYTLGVICAKVARYAERIHHPDRLTRPLIRTGPKGSGQFKPISWDDALDITAEKLLAAEARHGAESVWPYYYAGTMGHVQRDGINRLRHVKKYSGMHDAFCTNMAWTGFMAGTGRLGGPDPREMGKSDLVIIWGTNAVNTQVNVMTHAARARKERGARIVAIDIYRNGTMEQADLALCLKPGTDGALACAVMHVLFRDGHADWDYLDKFTDHPRELERHLQDKTPQWASSITGLPVEEIETFARMIGTTKRAYFRLGYGFSRQRNGAVNMHAAACIPAITGAWQHEGGGAFHINTSIYHWRKTLIEGLDALDPSVRILDQARIGPVLLGDPHDIAGGPPVEALFIQNTNPVSVAPEQEKVKRGFAREDLFTCVHEQFMTETARMADIVLPATMFLEHDDVYSGGGHMHIMLGPKIIEAPGECRENHVVHCELARRLGAVHEGFTLSARDLIGRTLSDSGWGTLAGLEEKHWIDCQPDFETAHFLNGFATGDGKFRFMPDWPSIRGQRPPPMGPYGEMPPLPDHWAVIEAASQDCPFRLATSPSRSFLNSTFNETPSSVKREGRPEVMIHPGDAAALSIGDGDKVVLGNERGEVRLFARHFDGVRRGVLIAEGIWPNDAFEDGKGINTLTGADQVAPYGGAAFHDNHAWIRRA